ncbi:MAG: heparin lyase I family protein [Saprospiraceae bacterium]
MNKLPNSGILKTSLKILLVLMALNGCNNNPLGDGTLVLEPPPVSMDPSSVTAWTWDTITIPPYSYPDGAAFGPGLFINTAYDTMGVSIVGDRMRFDLNPITPTPPAGSSSPHNYRSEIHTDPWQINHPLGTEQWIGWRYDFSDDYVIDPTSPITIFQNHPGIGGLSPILELEIAGQNDPAPALGGEIQVVNVNDRIIYPVTPLAGQSLDVVIHIVYGLGDDGLTQVWLNGQLYHDKIEQTVLTDYPWGGNNKWGIYHHTFKNSPSDVQASINAGAGFVELFMGTLRMITRAPGHPEYKLDAYDLVKPGQ